MLFFVVIAALNIICNGQPPMKGGDTPVAAGNLLHTFGRDEQIPAGFLDNPSGTQRGNEVFRPACQDGSGGMCVELGQCPPQLRPETNNTNACPPGMECCFGPAMNDNSCRSRGGECTSVARCGNAPVFRGATDCDTAKGEVCCIFVI